jgi:di/tripeptidase
VATQLGSPSRPADIVRKAQAVHVGVHGASSGVSPSTSSSFGPHIVDVHSPSERLKISSVEPFWAI